MARPRFNNQRLRIPTVGNDHLSRDNLMRADNALILERQYSSQQKKKVLIIASSITLLLFTGLIVRKVKKNKKEKK